MSEPKTYMMYYPGKTKDGRATYVEHALEATDREQAKEQCMAVVRVMDLKDAYIAESPGTLVFFSWPMQKS